MRKLGCIISFFIMMLLMSAGSSFSEPYTHPGTELFFPDHLAGMEKTNITDFEKNHPGLGISVGYNDPRITATIYLYTMGMSSVPEDTDSPVFDAHFRQTAEDVFTAGRKGLWNNVRKTSEETLYIGPSQTGRKALCDSFSYSRNQEDLLSKLCLFTYRNHFIKIRFTYGRDIRTNAEKAFEKLLEALAGEMETETL